MTEAEAFATRLMTWARQYRARPLENLAKRMQQQVEAFDIVGLAKTLHSFPEVVGRISEMEKKS